MAQQSATSVDIITDNWILRSDPPAHISNGQFALSAQDPDLHTTFDHVAGLNCESHNITFYLDHTPTLTINTNDLPDEIVDGVKNRVPEYSKGGQ